MKKIIFMLTFVMLTFTSCMSSNQFIYDDPVQKVYISTQYYDYSNGLSVVYINKVPYYQFYDRYNKYWYRKPVPMHKHCYIKYREPKIIQTHHRHHNNHGSRPSPKPNQPRPHNKPNQPRSVPQHRHR